MMRSRSREIILAGVCLALILPNCAGMNLEPERAYFWANDVYLYHYYLYVDQVASPAYTREEMQEFRENPEKIKNMQVNPDISDEQWEVLEKKKGILKEMEMVLEAVRSSRSLGEKPPKEQIDLLERLGNQLISLIE
jgi:hypothetical protein